MGNCPGVADPRDLLDHGFAVGFFAGPLDMAGSSLMALCTMLRLFLMRLPPDRLLRSSIRDTGRKARYPCRDRSQASIRPSWVLSGTSSVDR